MANTSVAVGKAFEKQWADSCPDDMLLIRLKDGKGYSKNPCDYILLTRFAGYMIELKTTKEKRLPKANIRDHQLAILSEASKLGLHAYFIINFRSFDETYVIAGDTLEKAFEGVKSIPIQWFRDNCKRINQTKKRTRWRYEYPFI